MANGILLRAKGVIINIKGGILFAQVSTIYWASWISNLVRPWPLWRKGPD